MAYAFVQVASPGAVGGSANIYTLAMPATTAGSVLTLAIAYASNNRDVLSVADDVGGSWTRGPIGGISTTGMGAYYCTNAPTSARTITVTFDSTGVSGVFLICSEYSGLLTASAKDQSSALATAVAASVTTGSVTTLQATELLWTFGRSENVSRPLTTPSGYTSRVALDTTRIVVADSRQTVAGTQTVQWACSGGNSNLGALLLTFKEIVATSAVFRPSGLDGLTPSGSLNFNPTL